MKDHPEMYTKANACYLDKAQKDALWNQIGEEIGHTGPEVHRWFNSQHTTYGKLTSKMKKFSSGAYHLTGRAKCMLTQFGFLKGHILRKNSNHSAGFSTSTVAMRSDESRGLGTKRASIDTSVSSLGFQQPQLPCHNSRKIRISEC